MKIAIYKTGHEIADRVAESFMKGIPDGASIKHSVGSGRWFDMCIGYGILRGTGEAFKEAQTQGKPYFNLDRGYFHPGHFDGYYRISCGGTQQTYDWPAPDYKRLDALNLDIKPWRRFDANKPVLVIPPSDYVCDFFGIHKQQWIHEQKNVLVNDNYTVTIRSKDDKSELKLERYSFVVTFNSSIGWQALQAGIPCVSDPKSSIIGSHYKNLPLDELEEFQHSSRERLFAIMSALQFTLEEIEHGKAWPLIQKYISAGMTANPSAPMSPPIVSAVAPPSPSASNT